jgi:protein associated with RNAse G/E
MDTLEINAGNEITVRAFKYGGAEHRSWKARVAEQQGSLLILEAEFEIEVTHESLGTVSRGTRTVEYYWFDRWYNVFKFLNDAGDTRLYYCNINMPPTFVNGRLSYLDLDIDVLVQPDLSYQVLDLQEFKVNAIRFSYSSEVKSRAHAAVDEVISMTEKRQFPFDGPGLV